MSLKHELSEVQKHILESNGNIIVNASAGTGKTYIMVEKIVKFVKESSKSFAAVTFTIKAAKEIRSRLPIEISSHYIGTNNSFVVDEIIQPFMKDVYGNEFDMTIQPDYLTRKISAFSEGIMYIKNTGKIYSYEDNNKNFIFELGLDILMNSKAAKRYIVCKYSKLFIDEYQDSDSDMHNLFMYLCVTLGIDTFVVGDIKQSIYRWRGAKPELFENIWKRADFSRFEMHESYRSTREIQNYANLLVESNRGYYTASSGDNYPKLLIYDSKRVDIYQILVDEYIGDEICVLRRKNDDCKLIVDAFSKKGVDIEFVVPTPFDNISKDSIWITLEIAKYFLTKGYSEYDFGQILPIELPIKEIKNFLHRIEENMNDNVKVNNICEEIYSILGYEYDASFSIALMETIQDEKYHPYFNNEISKYSTMTTHSCKGLEFDTVLIFATDYYYLKLDDIRLHYVAATRAKKDLIILLDSNDWKKNSYNDYLKNIEDQTGIKYSEFIDIIQYK